MATIGLFFGTDTGTTRRVAKLIKKTLSDRIDKPVNIRNANVAELLQYDLLILGAPTYGDGELPGQSTGHMSDSWEEFLPKLKGSDFSGKTIALYGLADQKRFSDHFACAMRFLYDSFIDCGADIIGQTPVDNSYKFSHSTAVIDNQFVGLVLDEDNQKDLTPTRLNEWLNQLELLPS